MGYPSGTDLIWSPMTRAETDDLSALLTAIEHLDEPIERHSIDSLREMWDHTDFDPRETLLGRDSGGTLVAYAHNEPAGHDVDPRRIYVMGGVHPGWRGRGIGTAVLRWQVSRAREWYVRSYQPGHGALRILSAVDQKLEDRLTLFASAGLTPMRWFADMSLNLRTEILPERVEIDGIRLVRYTDELSEAVRDAHNAAFADHWGSQPVDRDRWEEQLSASTFRPQWSWVALDDAGPAAEPAHVTAGAVVGYAMSSAYEQDWEPQGFKEGWTDRLGVRRHFRGRGIASALLAASAWSFAEAGLDSAGLGVDSDSPSGAQQLYEHLGYRTGETQVMYGRTETHEQLLGRPPSPGQQPG